MTILTLLVALTLAQAPPANPAQYGEFEGTVEARWQDDGRSMTLLNDFSYVDPDMKKWTAEKGSTIAGASIPQVFWTLIGGPFEGKYRNASVVHDVECQKKRNPWQKVHYMFYLASLRGGVDLVKAKTMYAAVYHFGPRWGLAAAPTIFTETDFKRLRVKIEQNPQLGLQQIEEATTQSLQREFPSVQ